MSQESSSLLPVYLAMGDDSLKQEAVATRLKKRLAAYGDLSFNSDSFDGEKSSIDAIIDACNTLPFASELRLVTVNKVEKLRKADQEKLIAYLKAPNKTTVLALFSNTANRSSRLAKAVAAHGKTALIDCSTVKRRDLPSLVAKMARTHGISITHDAASALIQAVGEDTLQLDGELRKIALAHVGSDAVNEAEISLMVSHRAEIKPWEFVNALSARNKSRCIYCLSHMDSVSPFALLSMCVTRIRELLITHACIEMHETKLLAEILKQPEWRVKNHVTWARNYPPEKLREALRRVEVAEQAMKSGGKDPKDAFLEWTLALLNA